jgi:hypothetical protein
MNHLIQLLLPLQMNDGRPISMETYRRIREELLSKFGGVTSYSRAPAQGLWSEDGSSNGAAVQDDILMLEVMVEFIDYAWWSAYREGLRHDLGQETLVVRATSMQML